MSQITKPTYYRPGRVFENDGSVHELPGQGGEGGEGEEWVLVDGTPATCAQLGLFHFFGESGGVDVVVSGPNYGRLVLWFFIMFVYYVVCCFSLLKKMKKKQSKARLGSSFERFLCDVLLQAVLV